MQAAPMTPEHAAAIDAVLHGNPNTVRAYRAALNRWTAWCETSGADIVAPTVGQCRDYQEHLLGVTRSNASVNLWRTAVSTLIERAIDDQRPGAPAANPWRKVPPPKVPTVSTTPFLETAELRQLIDWAAVNAEPCTYALVRLCGVLGLRLSEALAFDTRHLTGTDDGWSYRHRVKGGSEHVTPVDDRTVDAIGAAMGERAPGLVFPGDADPDRPVDQTTARGWVKAACRGAGVPQVSPHGLRHSAITTVIRAVGVDHGQALAHHAKAETTARYDRRTDRPTVALSAIVAAIDENPNHGG